MLGRVVRWLLEPLEGYRDLTCPRCEAKVTGDTPMCPMCGHDMSQTLLEHQAMNTSLTGSADAAARRELRRKHDELEQAPTISN